MNPHWSPHVAGLTPYTPGEQPRGGIVADLLKLNTNENPYAPSPRVLEAVRACATDALRLYPDYSSLALREAIAALHGIGADQVFLGNGSDEVLAHVFNALFRKPGHPLVMPDITYSFYRTYCALYGIDVEFAALANDFSITVEDYTRPRAVIPAGIIFANPNAPTGMALAVGDIERILVANRDCPVVIDEAYVDFGAESVVPLLARHANLVVVQTLSKSRALAGLRVGFALAGTAIVEGLIRVKDSFNSYPLDRVAQAGALAAIQDVAYFDATRKKIMAARDGLTRDLASLGFEVLPSCANFVFARHPGRPAGELSRALRNEHILVRHFRLPRIEEFLRITVGTPDDCRRLCRVLSGVLGKS
ncbi:MAG: histidinol-phosphate transaminase [Candidimonas sp.]|nr:MAG: histidinol-phosphate transaminase [Candidimonas sp.]